MITEKVSTESDIVKQQKPINRNSFWYKADKQKELILISIPFFIYIFIFSYLPLAGLTMAFQNYKPQKILF